MDCAAVASHLVAYQFATLDAPDRDAIDEHLLACRSCLQTYLRLKHASERAPLDKPSPAVKKRLRASVEEAFAKAPPNASTDRARASVLTLRIPLYQGFIAVALAAAIALAGPGLVERFSSRGGAGTPVIDSARPRAESFGIY